MSQKSKLIGGLVLILVIGVAAFAFLKRPHKTPTAIVKTKQENKSSNYVPVVAKNGNLVEGFSPDLVLDPTAKLILSYKTDLHNGTYSYVANYSTQTAMPELYNNYLNFFNKQGYIIKDKALDSKTAHIYTKKGSATTNLVISTSISTKNNSTFFVITTVK